MLVLAETIFLGFLPLPAALSVLGIIPGLIILVFLGILDLYTGHVIGRFKLSYPHVYSMADAWEIFFSNIGREVFGSSQLFFNVFLRALHILCFSMMINTITSRGTYIIILMATGTLIGLVFTLPRTMRNLGYYCIIIIAGIIIAGAITMTGVLITKPGFDLTSGKQKLDLFPPASVLFHERFLAMTNMVFVHVGHVALSCFILDLRNPRDLLKHSHFFSVAT